ncbi:hypothetical protein [Halosimplex halophilum]|uniref:hypothetical protein n=1 Tax=Halosimplex halophilum TaxID=2559572 RepID=UPI00107F90BB|nr:hypothetical protein [Halosimplex halophilum]
MATTETTQPSLTLTASGDRALAFFERRIWHDGHICSGCFARLRRSTTDEHGDWGETTEQTWRTDDAVDGHDVLAKGTVGVETTRHPADGKVTGTAPKRESTSTYHVVPRTTCGECGSVGGRAGSETLSTGEAIDRVPRLVERLREQGFAVDADRVFDVVRHLKTTPDRASDDKRIFATAAAMGVESARP